MTMFQIDVQKAPPLSVPAEPQDPELQLPGKNAPFLMWHNFAGLIVSPMTRTLPLEIPTYSDSKRIEDCLKPRHLDDELAYYAFYPRKPIHGSYLFSVLAITPQEMEKEMENIDRGYVASSDLQKRLAGLEDSLLSVGFSLLGRLDAGKRQHLPHLSFPRWPSSFGYKKVHGTPHDALYSLRRSLEAFTMLTAFVSFTLSLWLTEYEATCLDKAFEMLATRSVDPVPRVWLQYFRETIVCDFSPGLRPGAFLNAHTTRIKPLSVPFTFASVPLWFVWGHNFGEEAQVVPRDLHMYKFLPPLHIIEEVKRRPLDFRRIILPSSQSYIFRPDTRPREHYAAPIQSNDYCEDYAPLPDGVYFPDPDPTEVLPATFDRKSVIEEHSRQLPRESWVQFSKRMEAGLEKRKKIENTKERQNREALEQTARQGQYTSDTIVFIWKQDEMDRDFYRRVRVITPEVVFYWNGSTKYQRCFWSHLKEWDICPQLPPYPQGVAQPRIENLPHTIDQIDYVNVRNISVSQQEAQRSTLVADRMLAAVRDATSLDSSSDDKQHRFTLLKLNAYLEYRHGFDLAATASRSTQPPVLPGHAFYSPPDQPAIALKKVLYTTELAKLNENTTLSLIDFLNTACSTNLTLDSLPPTWDINSQGRGALYVDRKKFITFRANTAIPGEKSSNLFVIRPPLHSAEKSPWFIATTSATTVLLIYRSSWSTMLEVARGLLTFGIPFCTVLEKRQAQSEGPRPWKYKTIGLGLRPRGFKPTIEDYAAYKQARSLVLKSWRGRAIRLHGGILGRIASETVPDVEVLDGPLRANELVGTLGDVGFFDDGVDSEDLDIVSGVYVVTQTRGEAHMSWWPKNTTWNQTGLAGDQWSPLAEEFYEKRRQALESGMYHLPTATNWR